MRRRAVLAALLGLVGAPATVLPVPLGGCSSAPTLPLPPPVVSVGAPSSEGLATVAGMANALAHVHVLNQATDQGKIARASELGAFPIGLARRAGDTLVVRQERDGDTGERSEHVVPHAPSVSRKLSSGCGFLAAFPGDRLDRGCLYFLAWSAGPPMQSAMRDLDQLRERSDETTVRRLGLFVMAGVLGAAALMALGIVSGSSGEPPSAGDPLAALGATAAGNDDTPVDPDVALARLSFPATLVGDEATIEATVEAAAAEHAALTGRAESGLARPSSRVARASTLPASTLATEQTARLIRSAKHDPLVAEALPERSADGTIAPPGSEGAFTLQVVSYEKRDDAERFVDALRLRGHRAYIGQADVPGRSRYYRVRVGPFASRREAVEYQRRFSLSERMQTLVVAAQ